MSPHSDNSPNTAPIADVRDRSLLRGALVACQAAAIGLTWSLWQVRAASDGAPNLPLIDAAWVDRLQLSMGWPLLASLALAVIWPRVGIVAHAALLVLAILLDQMRIQPEFVSVAILLIGTLAARGPLLVARCHLVSLWFFAGLHKLLCPEYWEETGPYLARLLLPNLSDRMAYLEGIVIASCELLLGVLAVFPRTRRVVPWLAVAIHGGILLSLINSRWNTAVWPWNVALAAAAVAYFAGWKGHFFPRSDLLPAEPVLSTQRSLPLTQTNPLDRWGWQAAAILALLHPALYYVNCGDAYLSWCVYSNNTPSGTYYMAEDHDPASDQLPAWQLLAGGGEELLFREYQQINVPFPPAPRLYRQYLRRTGKPGDSILIDDPRPWSRLWGRQKLLLLLRQDGTISQTILSSNL